MEALLLGFLYFVPTLVAWKRVHSNITAIFALNFFGGITIVGWLAALVWALAN